MWGYLIVALLGAAVSGRRQPTTPCQKLTALGPQTGNQYAVDDFRAAGFVVVHASDGTMATFLRDGTRLSYRDGKGSPQTLEAIRRDFQTEEPAA